MIRTPPQHSTTHPPGQVVNEIGVPDNPIHQEKTLVKEIEEYRKKVQNGDFT